MLDFPENVKDLLKKDDTYKRFQLSFKGFTIENDRIISESLQLKQSLFSGDDFSVWSLRKLRIANCSSKCLREYFW